MSACQIADLGIRQAPVRRPRHHQPPDRGPVEHARPWPDLRLRDTRALQAIVRQSGCDASRPRSRGPPHGRPISPRPERPVPSTRRSGTHGSSCRSAAPPPPLRAPRAQEFARGQIGPMGDQIPLERLEILEMPVETAPRDAETRREGLRLERVMPLFGQFPRAKSSQSVFSSRAIPQSVHKCIENPPIAGKPSASGNASSSMCRCPIHHTLQRSLSGNLPAQRVETAHPTAHISSNSN
jgi:hypothetical protein